MRVTVYCSEVAVYHRDTLRANWTEYRFASSPLVVIEQAEGVSVVWSTAQPIEIDAPALSRLEPIDLPSHTASHGKTVAVVPERIRLVTPYDAFGVDATSVHTLAKFGLRGFKLVVAEPTDQDLFVPTVHLSNAVENMHGDIHAAAWGIRFASKALPDHPTFLTASSLTPLGRVASTKDLSAVASWPDRTQAEDWMRGAGLDPEVSMPIGVGYLYPAVAEIPAEITGYGVVFELSSRAEALLPAPELPVSRPEPIAMDTPVEKPSRRRRDLAGQLAFAF